MQNYDIMHYEYYSLLRSGREKNASTGARILLSTNSGSTVAYILFLLIFVFLVARCPLCPPLWWCVVVVAWKSAALYGCARPLCPPPLVSSFFIQRFYKWSASLCLRVYVVVVICVASVRVCVRAFSVFLVRIT